MDGVASGSMSASGAALVLAGNVTVSGSGPGNLLLLGQITETGGPRSITITGTGPLRALRMVQFGTASFNNLFTGGLFIDGGTVATSGFGPQTLGATGSTLTVMPNGGTINAAASLSNGCSLGTIQLNGDLHIIGSGTLPLNNGTTAAVLQGGGSLILNNSSTGMTLYSNSPGNAGAQTGYYGAVVINQSELAQYSGNAGTFTLSGIAGVNTATNGALTGATSFDVRAGGTLALSNTTANTKQNGDRVGDTTPVNIRKRQLHAHWCRVFRARRILSGEPHREHRGAERGRHGCGDEHPGHRLRRDDHAQRRVALANRARNLPVPRCGPGRRHGRDARQRHVHL